MKFLIPIILFSGTAWGQMDLNGYFSSPGGAIVPKSVCASNVACTLDPGSVLTSSGAVVIASTVAAQSPLLTIRVQGKSASLFNNPTGDIFVTESNLTSPTLSWENRSDGSGTLDIVNNSASASDMSKIRMSNGTDSMVFYTGNATQLTLNASATGAVFRGAVNVGGAFQPLQRTKAQMAAITPAVGDVYSCSDCAHTYSLYVGTAATIMGFREVGTTNGVN